MIDSTFSYPEKPEKLPGRRPGRLLLAVACLPLAAAGVFGQTTTTIPPATGTSYISSTFALGQVVAGAQVFTSVGVTLLYSNLLSPSQYVLAADVKSQALAAFAAYPTPTDPPEAIAVSVGQALMSQNPQISGLTLAIAQVTLPTGIPTGGTTGANSYLIVLTANGNQVSDALPSRKATRRK